MDPIDDLIRRLGKAPSLGKVAEAAGLHRSTVLRIKTRENAPNMDTFQRLMAALKGNVVKPKRKVAQKG